MAKGQIFQPLRESQPLCMSSSFTYEGRKQMADELSRVKDRQLMKKVEGKEEFVMSWWVTAMPLPQISFFHQAQTRTYSKQLKDLLNPKYRENQYKMSQISSSYFPGLEQGVSTMSLLG